MLEQGTWSKDSDTAADPVIYLLVDVNTDALT